MFYKLREHIISLLKQGKFLKNHARGRILIKCDKVEQPPELYALSPFPIAITAISQLGAELL